MERIEDSSIDVPSPVKMKKKLHLDIRSSHLSPSSIGSTRNSVQIKKPDMFSPKLSKLPEINDRELIRSNSSLNKLREKKKERY